MAETQLLNLYHPLGGQGHIMQTPADHAKRPIGNWQSERAVDIKVPMGTPVYAVADGVISPGRWGFGAPRNTAAVFQGLKLHLIALDNKYYYAHLSKLAEGIAPGAKVKKRDLLGYSGIANGAAHLHFGVEKGDPVALLKGAAAGGG